MKPTHLALLLLVSICDSSPLVQGGLDGASTGGNQPSTTTPATTSTPVQISTTESTNGQPAPSSAALEQKSASNTQSKGPNGGAPHQLPHPQSSATDIGSAGGVLGSGNDPTLSPIFEQPAKINTAKSVPKTTAQPAPISNAPQPQPTEKHAASTTAAPVYKGPGGHNPIPRPESSVQSLGPVEGAPIETHQKASAKSWADVPHDQSTVAFLQSPKETHKQAPLPQTTVNLPQPVKSTAAPPAPQSSDCLLCGLTPHPQSSVESLQDAPVPTRAHPQSTVESLQEAPAPTRIPAAPKEEPKPKPISISTTPPAVITIGSSAITADSSSHFVIGSSVTLAPGSSAITHSGVVYSMPSSATAVIVGPSTQSIQPPAPSSTPVITLAGSTITADSASQFQIGSQTLAPGSAITSAGAVISLAPSASAVVVNGQTQQITPIYATPAPVITVGNSKITANSQSQFVIGSETLVPGSAITSSGAVISLAPSASAVVINGQTQQITPAYVASAAVITVGSSKITANSLSQYVIGSQTISAGSPAITVSNQVLSLASGGSALVFGPSTKAVGTASTFSVTSPPILTFGTQAITANAQSAYVIGTQTLQAGSQIVVSGSTISLAPSATALVVNGHTVSLTPHSILATVAPPLITVGPSILTADKHSDYVVAGQTLSAGGSAITVSGTRLSLASGGKDLVIGSSTEHLQPQILASSTEAPTLTFGNAHITADAASEYVIGSQTLLPGQAITVSGTILSLASDDAFLKVGSSTESLSGSVVTETQSGRTKKAHKTNYLAALTSGPNSLTGSFVTAQSTAAPSASATGKSAGVGVTSLQSWALSAACVLGVALRMVW